MTPFERRLWSGRRYFVSDLRIVSGIAELALDDAGDVHRLQTPLQRIFGLSTIFIDCSRLIDSPYGTSNHPIFHERSMQMTTLLHPSIPRITAPKRTHGGAPSHAPPDTRYVPGNSLA